jgi:DNA-binding transcriptional regulator YhcF (GntR family)
VTTFGKAAHSEKWAARSGAHFSIDTVAPLYYCTSTVNGTASIGLRIDAGDAVPIWKQIEDGIRRLVAKGALAAGAPVPSVRTLASELIVNPATVAKAYQRLADGGVLVVRRGEGTYVAATPPAMARGERAALVREAAQRYAGVVMTLGVAPAEAVDEVRKVLAEYERASAGGKR